MTIEKKSLLAVDLGYSNVKVCYYDDAGALQFDKYISSVSKVDTPIELDDDIMFQLEGNTYVMGASALKLSSDLLMPLETFEDMKAVYPIWLSYLFKKYGGRSKFKHVVVGLSMAFSDRVDELLDSLYETLMIREENFFLVLTQGLAASYAINTRNLDISETSSGHSGSNGPKNYILLDGGFLTCDFCAVVAGKASAGAAIGVPNTGCICIAYNIMDYLYKEYSMKVSIKEAQNILDADGIFVKRGRKYDISDQVKTFTRQYLGNIFSLLEDKYGSYLDSSDKLLVVGGVSYLLQKYQNDPEVIKEIEKHFSRSFIQWPEDLGEYYNCYSYLKAAEEKILPGMYANE